jgi:hypothetical protein
MKVCKELRQITSDDAAFLSRVTLRQSNNPSEQGETGEEQSQEHAHHFL